MRRINRQIQYFDGCYFPNHTLSIRRVLSEDNFNSKSNDHNHFSQPKKVTSHHITSHHNVPLGMIVISSLDELQKFAILLAEYTI